MRWIKSQLKCKEEKKLASLKIVQGTAPTTLACFDRILVPNMHKGEESLSEGGLVTYECAGSSHVGKKLVSIKKDTRNGAHDTACVAFILAPKAYKAKASHAEGEGLVTCE